MANSLEAFLYALATNQPNLQRLLMATGGEMAVSAVPIQRGRLVTLAPVAGRTPSPAAVPNAGLNPYMNASFHWARDNISAMQVLWPNWCCTGAAENGTGGTVTLRASVEYPLGSFTQLTFSGAPSVTIPNFTTQPSDIVTLNTPIPLGARFRIRSLWVPNAGSTNLPVNPSSGYHVVTSGTPANNVGDAQEQTAVDKTLSGNVIDRGVNLHTPPCAILGYTAKPSIALLGDSRQSGLQDTVADGNGEAGELARIFGPGYGTLNLGCSGETTVGFLTLANSAQRRALAALCTMAACQYGINDVTAGTSVATIEANLTSIVNLFPTLPFVLGTMPPVSTTTDNWATTVNQTTNANNGNRVSVNNWIRLASAVAANLVGYIELADQVESARDSGLWAVTGVAFGYTPDGVHENSFANRLRAAPWPLTFLRQGI